MSSIIASSDRPLAARDSGHRARGVVERLDPHRLRQPAGRVDGEHADLPAALGRAQREGGGGGGLADAAGAAADDDPGVGVVEQAVDVERVGVVAGGGERADAGAVGLLGHRGVMPSLRP